MSKKSNKKSQFGEFLAQLIIDAKMSQYDFYNAAEITKPYFYDMLSGRTNPPPRDTLERMLNVLENRLPPDKERRRTFFNYAAIGRGEIPCDISEMIIEHPECWDNLRTTLLKMLTSSK